MHLTERALREVGRILRRHVPGTEVWAFGSRVHERKLKRFSDLDLALTGGRPLPGAVPAALKVDFAESDLPFRVDLVERGDLDEGLRQVVEAEYEILLQPQASPPAEAR
jgi:predicted nucleotidyltransferase